MTMAHESLPRLPVFGWQALRGGRRSAQPCMLDLPGRHYTTSGRAAILLALESLGVQRGDGVLLPTYHCPTMVAPTTHLGAVPRFYPIDAQGMPDLAWLTAQDLSGVRVLLAAHYFGLPQAMGRVRAWCHERGISLIEDCAHALFGQAGERAIGAWGDVAIGSLTKFLPVPEGGCLVLNSGQPAPVLSPCAATQHLSAALDIVEVGAAQGQLPGLNGLVTGGLNLLRRLRGHSAETRPEVEPTIGAEASGDELCIDARQAHRRPSVPVTWLADRLPRERIVRRRRENYAWLLQRLAGHDGLRPLLPTLPDGAAPYVFPLWVDTPDPGYQMLRRRGMPVFRWDRLWPGLPPLPDDHGRLWSHHVVQLACHQDLQPAQLETFARAVLELCARPRSAG